eukprot:CAMPEP_0176486822 /NCGR_PEP_ID=MMETSP0200_2-20121128/5781_1 /TAXON_ID=947934 /ORGANISM="Chaetoceros sp., Strain GSL56" /LENGTH=874 /DNA_ID=CAMNT_0017883565 /DNA_START=199 /DNA_END=2823 /DNA_ORIENTATION=+
MNANIINKDKNQNQESQEEEEEVHGFDMEEPDVSDISTSSLGEEEEQGNIDRNEYKEFPYIDNFHDGEGAPYGPDEEAVSSEDYNIGRVSGADILLRNRCFVLGGESGDGGGNSSGIEMKSNGPHIWNSCDLIENNTKLSSRLPSRFTSSSNGGGNSNPFARLSVSGFSAMYEESLSQASRVHSANKFAARNVHVPSKSSDPSGSSTGQSPYYERTGAWLRLRPQNPAMFPLNAPCMSDYNTRKNQTNYFSSRSSSSVGNGSDIRGKLSVQSQSIPTGQPPYDDDDKDAAEMVTTAIDEGCDHVQHETPNPQDRITVDDELLDVEDTRETLHFKNHGEEVTIVKGPIFHQLSSLPIDGIDSQDQPKSSQVNHSVVSLNDTQWASPDSKYERYTCRVDQNQGDKSVEIPLFVFQRPHMRAFHFAWMSFFVAFFTWFAIAPLLPEIRKSLNLSHREIWMSNVLGSAGTVVCRVIVGPLNDRFGARMVMATTLVVSSIPVMATGLVNSSVELSILRLFTGIAGSSFVTCQYWTSCMFTREVAGTANSLVAGWGNLGGGVTQIVMGSVLFPLFKLVYNGEGIDERDAATRAWRVVCVVPAILSFIMAILIIRYSDDSPKGNYKKLRRQGQMQNIEAKNALKLAASNVNTWILAFHYACCFGAEVTMTAGAALYFSDEFQQKTESAAALASIFGWMNLFARGLGGFLSDIMNAKYGMKGRLYWQFATILFEGFFLLAFAYAKTLGTAICGMVFFSLFVQSSEGSTYSIVPYVCPKVTGSVAGLVGAGGNLGGVVFLVMIQEWNYRPAFKVMAVCVICSSFLSFFISIRGYDGFCRNTAPEEVEVVAIDFSIHKQEGLVNVGVDEHKTAATSYVPATERR